jgi:histone arginine demethylase JMJD6
MISQLARASVVPRREHTDATGPRMAEAGVGFNPADLSDVMLPIPDWSSDDEDETKIEATDSSSDVCSNTPFQISLSIPSSTTTRVTDEALAERVGAGPTAASLPPPDTAHADGLWCPPAAPTLNRVAVRRLLDQLCGEVVAHTSDTSAAAALKGGGAACALTEVSIDKVLGDLEAWAAAGLPGASPHGAQSAELHPILLAARAHLLHHCDNHSAAVAGWAWARRAWYQATNRPEPAPWRFDAHLACIAEQSARGRRAYTVDSRAAAALPLGEFHSRYSQQQQPVLITGLGPHLVPELGVGWLLKSVGSKRVGVYTHGSHRGSAPRSRLMLMSELLEAIHTGTGSATADSLYLYDVSIPKQLPGLLEHLRIPRYFVHDFLTRTMHPHPWSLNWPSLFVGSVGTCSSIHVDQWHGSFWMVMVAGRKRWTLWHPADTAMLYPAWRRGRLAPEFPSLESLEGQSDTYPLFHQARRTVVVVGPGDVLFVPGGTPHFVENLTPTVAYAGNFLDEGNFDAALEDMQLLGLLSEPIREAAASIGATDFSLPAPPLGGDAPPLRPEHQVVHYHDYLSGEAATWHGPPPTPVAFDTALWGQGGPHSAVDPPAAPLSAVVHAPLSAVPSSMEADVAALL